MSEDVMAAFFLGDKQWLYHLADAETDESHPVIPAHPGTTLADLVRAVRAHRCT